MILEKSKTSEQGWFGMRYSTLNESNDVNALDSTETTTKDGVSEILCSFIEGKLDWGRRRKIDSSFICDGFSFNNVRDVPRD